MAGRVLVDNGYFRLSVDDAPGVLRLVRSSKPFPTLEALHAAAREVEAATTRRKGAALLIDAREAPARNDVAFEQEFALARRRMLAPCARIAVLVRSAAGKLQVGRYAREDGATGPIVFFEEAEALSFLADPGPA